MSSRAGEERPSFFCPEGAVQGSLRWFVLWVCAEGHGLLLQLLQLSHFLTRMALFALVNRAQRTGYEEVSRCFLLSGPSSPSSRAFWAGHPLCWGHLGTIALCQQCSKVRVPWWWDSPPRVGATAV